MEKSSRFFRVGKVSVFDFFSSCRRHIIGIFIFSLFGFLFSASLVFIFPKNLYTFDSLIVISDSVNDTSILPSINDVILSDKTLELSYLDLIEKKIYHSDGSKITKTDISSSLSSSYYLTKNRYTFRPVFSSSDFAICGSVLNSVADISVDLINQEFGASYVSKTVSAQLYTKTNLRSFVLLPFGLFVGCFSGVFVFFLFDFLSKKIMFKADFQSLGKNVNQLSFYRKGEKNVLFLNSVQHKDQLPEDAFFQDLVYKASEIFPERLSFLFLRDFSEVEPLLDFSVPYFAKQGFNVFVILGFPFNDPCAVDFENDGRWMISEKNGFSILFLKHQTDDSYFSSSDFSYFLCLFQKKNRLLIFIPEALSKIHNSQIIDNNVSASVLSCYQGRSYYQDLVSFSGLLSGIRSLSSIAFLRPHHKPLFSGKTKAQSK